MRVKDHIDRSHRSQDTKITTDPTSISVADDHTSPTNFKDKIIIVGRNNIKTFLRVHFFYLEKNVDPIIFNIIQHLRFSKTR